MKTKEEIAADDALSRCYNSNNKNYAQYGGRGITVCDAWIFNRPKFINYLKALPPADKTGYTLDRIDNNKGYEPGNLRWTDIKTQARNKRNNLYAHYFGQRMLLIDISDITSIAYSTLKDRYYRGLDNEELIKPVKKRLPKSDLVLIQDNQVYTTSLKIAEVFEKRHDHVIRDIRKLMSDLEQILTNPNLGALDSAKPKSTNLKTWDVKSMIIEGNYQDTKGEMRPMYYLNRDALTLLVMKFEGLKALEWKLKYITEFNRMETALKK